MDADDICCYDRFEKQLNCFMKDSSLSIVGGQITEFVGESNNVTGMRVVPEKHNEIAKYMKKRCPMNQVTAMFKKEEVEKAGGYIDWYCEEDYYLWIRMMEHGCSFANVPDVLVNVRTGEAMAGRRGGWKYFFSEAKLQQYMLKKRIISPIRYLYNVAIRFGGEVVLNDKMRQKLFSLVREKADSDMKEYSIVGKTETKNFSERDNAAYPPFSVSMCVYGGDDAEWFDVALESVINQTVRPSEIVLVVDGPIPQTIQDVIHKYENICERKEL